MPTPRSCLRPLVILLMVLVVPSTAGAQERREVEKDPPLKSVLRVVGGAVVGGWIGWMGSQVLHSDWDRVANEDAVRLRMPWLIGGMTAGAVAGYLLGSAAPGTAQPVLSPPVSTARSVIGEADIAASGARNARELISTLRPEWLTTRGVSRWSESGRGEASGSGMEQRPAATVVVYLDGVRVGGIEALDEIGVENLRRAEFLQSHEAVATFGSGHAHGAIVLRLR